MNEQTIEREKLEHDDDAPKMVHIVDRKRSGDGKIWSLCGVPLLIIHPPGSKPIDCVVCQELRRP